MRTDNGHVNGRLPVPAKAGPLADQPLAYGTPSPPGLGGGGLLRHWGPNVRLFFFRIFLVKGLGIAWLY